MWFLGISGRCQRVSGIQEVCKGYQESFRDIPDRFQWILESFRRRHGTSSGPQGLKSCQAVQRIYEICRGFHCRGFKLSFQEGRIQGISEGVSGKLGLNPACS